MKKYTFLFFILLTAHGYSQTWKVYNTSNSGIPSDNVTGISIGSDGKKWISTLSGIASFDTQWQRFGLNGSTSSYDEIHTIWCKNNLIWLGTESRGLYSFDGISTWKNYDPYSSGNGIVGLGIDNQDTIWRLDKFGRFSKWTGTQWKDRLTFIDHPNSLFADKNGNKWIISGNVGLIKYSNGSIFKYNATWSQSSPNYIPDASLYCMVQDSKGNLWIGGDYKGLLRFDGQNFTFFDTQNSSICSNRIRALAIDENDVLWIGSWDGGVSRFDGTVWKTFNTTNSPLSSNIVNSIAIDKEHKIWIANGYNEFMSPSGGKGIVVFDQAADNSGGVAPAAPVNLTIKGISVNEVVLNWTDKSDNETGFIIECSKNDTLNFKQLKFVTENATTFTDYSVTGGAVYYYRVFAVNSVGRSANSNIASIIPKYCTVDKSNYTAYANVTGFKFGTISNSVFHTLNGYYDYLNLYTELVPGQTLMMTISFDRYSITTDNIIGGVVFIDWNGNGDFSDNGETVFKNLNIKGKGTFTFPVHAPETISPGTIRLRARAVSHTYADIRPCGYAEETQDYTIKVMQSTPLARPTLLYAKGLTSEKIGLTWQDNSTGESNYLLLRGNDSVHFDKKILIEKNTAEYTDNGLSRDTEYFYKLSAISGTDTSGYSNVARVFTQSVGLIKETNGSIISQKSFSVGAFWGDYNNDGKPDIFVSGENYLYINDNHVLNSSQLSFKSHGSAAWGDYNNDGYPDLFATSYNYAGGNPDNILYKNNGNSTFSEIPFKSDGRVNNCVWLDFNKDGKLDLFLSYIDLDYGEIYLNNIFNIFSDSIKIAGASGFTTFADYDNDGDMDMFVAKYNNSMLLQNNGDRTFKNVANFLPGITLENSTGASWGDIDNDGDLDLFVTRGQSGLHKNSLYLNDGHDSFEKIITGDVVTDAGQSYGSSFTDYDNDGNLDLAVANFQQNSFLYKGKGNGSFERMNQSPVMNEFSDVFLDRIPSMGCAWADYDQNGFPDLFIANNNGALNYLYKNSGNSNHWINLKLVGTRSNKSAIGAKVKIKTGDQIQYREITSQTGFAGQNDLAVSFGLGKNTKADSVIINWPSGIVQKLTNLSADQFLIIGESGTKAIEKINSEVSIDIFPNPVGDYLILNNDAPEEVLEIELVDLTGRSVKRLNSTGTQTILNVSDLGHGIYFLKVKWNKSVLTKKVIKY